MIEMMTVMVEEGVRAGIELAKEIMQMRQENGKPMSKYRLAKVMGLSEQAIDGWLDGEAAPKRVNFEKLVQYSRFLKQINQVRPFGRA